MEFKFKQNIGAEIDLDLFPSIRKLEGLDIVVEGSPYLKYRNDGEVSSIYNHVIHLTKQLGFVQKNKIMGYFIREWYEKHVSGNCRQFLIHLANSKSYAISIPFWEHTTNAMDIFNCGHEDMHAVQWLGLYSSFKKVEDRLKNVGLNIPLEQWDIESQADFAGFLRVIEEGYSPLEVLEGYYHLDREKSLHNHYLKLLKPVL